MQLKTAIWVKAYLRSVASQGAMATIVAHGDDDAGTILVKVARLDGRAALYGPAPAGLDTMSLDRCFSLLLDGETTSEADVDRRLERERDFDRDVWIVEVEDRQGRHFLDDWLESGR